MAGIFSERAWNKVWLYRTGFLKGLGTTAETAVFGLILALALGILFGLMATSNKKVLRGISRVYVEFFQNTPVLLQLCFLYYALAFSGNSIGILATGCIALGIYHGAYMAEVVRSGIQAVPKGQFEAAQSQGFNTVQIMVYIVLPQAYRSVIPTLLGQCITTIKDSSYLANVAVIELMSRVKKILSAANMYNGTGQINVSDVFILFGVAFVIYFIINFILSCTVRYLQKRSKRNKQVTVELLTTE